MTNFNSDVIDFLVGIDAGSHLDTVRAKRVEARTNAQQSYLALFAPSDIGTVTVLERFALATFVAGLHGDAAIADFYRAELKANDTAGVAQAIDAELALGQASGPYGHYPAGPLTSEDKAGLIYTVSEANRAVLGERLAAGLAHAHLLVFRPRDASPVALDTLLAAGWSATDIVTLSQLVSFLAFQIRVIIGLRALKAAQPAQSSAAAPALSNA